VLDFLAVTVFRPRGVEAGTFSLDYLLWGAALAQQGNRVEAMEHFQRALRMKPNSTRNP
jgi:Flp pilus assembly protein TadD